MALRKISLKQDKYLDIYVKGNKLFFGGNCINVKPDIRTIEQMRDVLLDEEISGPRECYYMYRGVCNRRHAKKISDSDFRYDITILPPLFLGNEFNKTYGHYHPKAKNGNSKLSYPEIYEVLHGKALFILQKEDFSKVYFIKAKKGEKVLVLPNYGHVTINDSYKCLVLANWVYSGFNSDYTIFKERHGAMFYKTREGIIKNKNYSNIPDIFFLRPKELFSFKSNKPIYNFVDDLEGITFLKNPDLIYDKIKDLL
ncbi:MAG: glucose-6-phosphate isomerase [Candidatus Diapherotrites archaeon]|nr:glucose-6-phosphate isomerase [Candidatus Diapherotrites archaeon]